MSLRDLTELVHFGLDKRRESAAAGGGDVEEQVVPVERERVQVEPVHRLRAPRVAEPARQVLPHKYGVLRGGEPREGQPMRL